MTFKNDFKAAEAQHTCSIRINPEHRPADTRAVRDIANQYGVFKHIDQDRGPDEDYAICIIPATALNLFQKAILSRPQPEIDPSSSELDQGIQAQRRKVDSSKFDYYDGWDIGLKT